LITGATDTYGTAIARKVLDEGHALAISSADKEQLDLLAQELGEGRPGAIVQLPEDVSLPGGGARLYNAINVKGITVDTLIHCPEDLRHAAFSESQKKSDAFAESELLYELAVMRREILSFTELVKCLGIVMLRRGNGRILCMNPGAQSPSAVRRGTHAYLDAFCRQVDREWRPGGVSVTRFEPDRLRPGCGYDEVASAVLKALERRSRLYPGSWLGRLFR
jgi:short-subunit dehydrogenase